MDLNELILRCLHECASKYCYEERVQSEPYISLNMLSEGIMSDTESQEASLELVSKIVVAFVSNNSVPTSELSGLIRSVHDALSHIGERPVQSREPAVPIRRSVQPNFIVCLEDGKKLKMLKRHLRTAFGLSPQEYRAKWGLPEDYPIVAPKYAKRRSELAKKIGLGRKPGERPKARKRAAS
jgi:predicted transcriptional regulator